MTNDQWAVKGVGNPIGLGSPLRRENMQN